MAPVQQKKYDPTNTHLRHPASIKPGRGPHHAQLWCLKCKKHIKWLTPAEITIWDNLK